MSIEWQLEEVRVPDPHRVAELVRIQTRDRADLRRASSPDNEYAKEAVALHTQVHFDNAADADRMAEAIAAEWPHFVAAVQARMADATNLPANARVVEDR